METLPVLGICIRQRLEIFRTDDAGAEDAFDFAWVFLFHFHAEVILPALIAGSSVGIVDVVACYWRISKPTHLATANCAERHCCSLTVGK